MASMTEEIESEQSRNVNSVHRSLPKVAKQLAVNVDFFREHAPDVAALETFPYRDLPEYYSSNQKSNDETTLFELRKRISRDTTNFPLIPKMGKLQVPMALLCEAKDDPQTIIVVLNYWRQLKAFRQRELKTSMQRFYVRPNVTNERLDLVSHPTKNTLRQRETQPASREQQRQFITPWGFRCLETCTQLAEALGLCHSGENSQHACDMLRTANLEVPRSNCKDENCIYPALARNHGYCCRHGLHFGPTSGRVNGRRGYLLLGDVYTRPYFASAPTDSPSNTNEETLSTHFTSPTVKKLTTCSCRNETCVGIGYSPTMIQFDIHRFPKELQDSIWSNSEALNMTAKTHFQSSRNQSNDENDSELSTRSSVLRLAPWHFHPQHRTFQPDGSWKLVDSFHTTNSTNETPFECDASFEKLKEWKKVPLPTYSPKEFLQEPIMKDYVARKTNVASSTDMLPSWCREYTKLEQGPSSISELQRTFLWDRSIELEQSLASKTVSFQTRERALEIELEKLRTKYNEKKFLKRRDKKRKRASNQKNKGGSETAADGKPSLSSALQEANISNNKKRTKKKRNEQMDKTVPNPSEYTDVGGRSNEGSESLNENESNHHRDSHRMGPMHYSTQPPQQHHRHHSYPHSYPPPHSQHLPHHHATVNRTPAMELPPHHPQHYHHHHQGQQQPQPQHGPYPQHHQAYQHHPGQTDQYGDGSQEHPPEVPQRPHQDQQRPPRQPYTDQQPQPQDWHQRGYYDN